MLVCALGYGDNLKNVTDAYPDLYLRQAENLNLTFRANGIVGQPASRGTVAMLVYNAVFTKV